MLEEGRRMYVCNRLDAMTLYNSQKDGTRHRSSGNRSALLCSGYVKSHKRFHLAPSRCPFLFPIVSLPHSFGDLLGPGIELLRGLVLEPLHDRLSVSFVQHGHRRTYLLGGRTSQR